MLNNAMVEFAGTLIFLYSIIATGNPIVFCTTLALVVCLGGYLGHAGGNYNPAITVMMVGAKKQPMNTLVPYIIAQIAGALTALQLYKRIH